MIEDPRGDAVALTFGLFDKPTAKTAHGLIRGSERFKLIGLIDPKLRAPDPRWPSLPPVLFQPPIQ